MAENRSLLPSPPVSLPLLPVIVFISRLLEPVGRRDHSFTWVAFPLMQKKRKEQALTLSMSLENLTAGHQDQNI